MTPDPMPLEAAPAVPDALVPIVADLDLEELTEVADLARLHASFVAVETVVGEARQPIRDRLNALALADAAGEGLSRRVAGVGTVTVDNPKPSARVTDPDAFAGWVEACDPPPLHVERRRRVEVVDHDRALEALDALDDLDYRLPSPEYAAANALRDALRVVDEIVLPADPIGAAVEAAACAVTHGGVVDLATGEYVPGTAVSAARPQRVTILPDKQAAAVAAAQVRAALAKLANTNRELARG